MEDWKTYNTSNGSMLKLPEINIRERFMRRWYCFRLLPASVSGMLIWGCSAAFTILRNMLLKSPNFELMGIGASIPMSWLTYKHKGATKYTQSSSMRRKFEKEKTITLLQGQQSYKKLIFPSIKRKTHFKAKLTQGVGVNWTSSINQGQQNGK